MSKKWELCDYTDEKGSYEIYEGRGLGRLVAELLNCAPDDAERIVDSVNARADLVKPDVEMPDIVELEAWATEHMPHKIFTVFLSVVRAAKPCTGTVGADVEIEGLAEAIDRLQKVRDALPHSTEKNPVLFSYKDIFKALDAAKAYSNGMTGWQPIETCTDGFIASDQVLLCEGKRADRRVSVGYRMCGKWKSITVHEDGFALTIEPTHWMPLPSAPKIQAGEK